MADSTGKVTRSILNSPWTEARQTTELGEIVFPKVLLDPKGDVVSIKATLVYPGSQVSLRDGYPADLMASTAVRRPVGDRLLFKLVPVLESETDTDAPPKVTAGVDGKGTAGPVEVGGKYERESGDRTVSRTFSAKVKSIALLRIS